MKEYTDTERLDWLVAHSVNVKRTWGGDFYVCARNGVKVYPTFREAIDAEMAREETK